MIVYWKSSTNQTLDSQAFVNLVHETERLIRSFGVNELYLNAELLDLFVKEKTEEFNRSYLKLNLPFSTFEACKQHLDSFYYDNAAIINSFPYDRWVWVKKLETLHYHDIDYVSVKVESKLIDVKESTVAHTYTN